MNGVVAAATAETDGVLAELAVGGALAETVAGGLKSLANVGRAQHPRLGLAASVVLGAATNVFGTLA